MPEAAAQRQLAREYELIYILRPNTGPSEARKVADRISDIVDKRGAKLTLVDNWGKRKLAYPIQKHTRGVFVFVKFVGMNDVVAELERNLRNLDDVMRWQTVRNEAELDLEAVEVDPDEVQFKDIELGEDEDEDPTFEERLGMKVRSRASDDEGDDSDDEGSDDEDSDTDSDDEDSDSDDDEKSSDEDEKSSDEEE